MKERQIVVLSGIYSSTTRSYAVYEVAKEDKYISLVLIVSTPKTSKALKKSIERIHQFMTWMFSKSAVSFSLHDDMKKLMPNDLR